MHTMQKLAGDPKVIPTPPTYYALLFVNGPVGIPLAKFKDCRMCARVVSFLNGGEDVQVDWGSGREHISQIIALAMHTGDIVG